MCCAAFYFALPTLSLLRLYLTVWAVAEGSSWRAGGMVSEEGVAVVHVVSCAASALDKCRQVAAAQIAVNVSLRMLQIFMVAGN